MRSHIARLLAVPLLLCALLGAAPLLCAQSAAAPTGNISMDFKDVEIHVLIKFISELTGKNFIVDRKVGGRVTIYSPTKITLDEAYKVFESVLTVNGFTVVPSGSAYKIVPTANARNLETITRTNQNIDSALVDEMVTQIVALKHSSAAELTKILPKITGPYALINAYTPTNTLILTGPYSVIRQAMRVVRQVDQSTYVPQLRTFKLEYGDAKSIATSLSKLMETRSKEQEKVGKQTFAQIQSDERTNTVISMADQESMASIENIITTLDVPTPKGKGDIHIIRLQNADAEDTAKVLNSLMERQGATKEEKILASDVKIVADKPTNSLVVTARPDDFDIINRTATELDVERKQVFIEALIMEASSTASFSFGVNWAGGKGRDDVFLYGSSNLGGGAISFPTTSDGGTLSFPSGGSIGAILEDAVTIGGTAYSIQAVLSAVEGDSNYRILATPQLLTLDNEEARVDVVDNVPFTKDASTSNVNEDYNSVSIDYKDVGIKLQITPHISANDTLRLEVLQEVSRVTSTTVSGTNIIAPTTRKREVETTIRMLDGQTAVIAGLLSEDDSNTHAKVPGAGDIPLLGWLFKNEEESNTKTNLLIFITPRVINSFEESTTLAEERRRTQHENLLGPSGLGLPVAGAPAQLAPIMRVGQ